MGALERISMSPLYKSSRLASRVVCETLDNDGDLFHGRTCRSTGTKKIGGHKIGNEKLVWFAPVSSPLVSPGREQVHLARKKKRKKKGSSIFTLPRKLRASLECEEPISPKVSCIGQVRANKKTFGEDKPSKTQQPKPGAASPARQPRKWKSLFPSRKDDLSCPKLPHYAGAAEVSCFGLPRHGVVVHSAGRSCGAVLAKSLMFLLQECGDRAQSTEVEIIPSRAPENIVGDQKGIHIAVPSDAGTASLVKEEDTGIEANSHALMARKLICKVPQQRTLLGHESPKDKKTNISSNVALDPIVENGDMTELTECQQESTYKSFANEVLPSLSCGHWHKKNLKISVEVVLETWLCRGGDKSSQRSSASPSSCAHESSMSGKRKESRTVDDKSTEAHSCCLGISLTPDQTQILSMDKGSDCAWGDLHNPSLSSLLVVGPNLSEHLVFLKAEQTKLMKAQLEAGSHKSEGEFREHLQWIKSDGELIRSRSAKSNRRTVVHLERSKSVPSESWQCLLRINP